MTQWATHGEILLAAAAALAGCGTPTTTALQGQSTHTTDQATSARIVTHRTSKTSTRVAAQNVGQASCQDYDVLLSGLARGGPVSQRLVDV